MGTMIGGRLHNCLEIYRHKEYRHFLYFVCRASDDYHNEKIWPCLFVQHFRAWTNPDKKLDDATVNGGPYLSYVTTKKIDSELEKIPYSKVIPQVKDVVLPALKALRWNFEIERD